MLCFFIVCYFKLIYEKWRSKKQYQCKVLFTLNHTLLINEKDFLFVCFESRYIVILHNFVFGNPRSYDKALKNDLIRVFNIVANNQFKNFLKRHFLLLKK